MYRRPLWLAGTAVFIVVVLFFVTDRDICSDEVRGYETAASSTLKAARDGLRKIDGSIGIDSGTKVAAQLDGLNVTTFPALKACDTQCKILAKCMRFVFFTAPSKACSDEYKDYKTRTDTALAFLKELKEVELRARDAGQKGEALKQRQQDIKELENSSGSTGGRLAQLKAELQSGKDELAQSVAGIGSRLQDLSEGERR